MAFPAPGNKQMSVTLAEELHERLKDLSPKEQAAAAAREIIETVFAKGEFVTPEVMEQRIEAFALLTEQFMRLLATNTFIHSLVDEIADKHSEICTLKDKTIESYQGQCNNYIFAVDNLYKLVTSLLDSIEGKAEPVSGDAITHIRNCIAVYQESRPIA